MKYTSKFTKAGARLLLAKSFPKKERKAYIVFFQKKRILKKIPVKLLVENNGKMKTAITHFEATHKCYVSHVSLYLDKTQVLTFTFPAPVVLDNAESLSMSNLYFGLK